MMGTPLVTIITNTKNRSNLIHRCIESIQNQTYKNYEHIIADGGNDDTEKIVNSYNDPHIKYIKVVCGGPIIQTKKAFELSHGEYITFLDDDDEYLPLKLEKQLELITSLSEDYGFIYGSMTYYDNTTGKELYCHHASLNGGRELLPLAISRPIISGTPTLMFRRNVFEDIGGTWIAGIGNEMSDWALCCKTLKRGWKVAALKDSFLKIYINHGFKRMSDPNFTKEQAEKYVQFHDYFINEYFRELKENPHCAEYHIRGLFCNNFILGHRKEGFKYWIKLVQIKCSIKHFLLLPLYILRSFR